MATATADAPAALQRSAGERAAPRLIMAAGGILLLAGGWALFAGLSLGRLKGRASAEEGRLKRVQAAMEDAPFRAQLATAVKTLGEDAVPFRVKLKGLCDKMGIPVEGSVTQTEAALPTLGVKEIAATLVFKDLMMDRILNYACRVELEIPGAVVVEANLKPIKDAGDRWEVRLKVAKRIKLSP